MFFEDDYWPVKSYLDVSVSQIILSSSVLFIICFLQLLCSQNITPVFRISESLQYRFYDYPSSFYKDRNNGGPALAHIAVQDFVLLFWWLESLEYSIVIKDKQWLKTRGHIAFALWMKFQATLLCVSYSRQCSLH